MRNNSKLILNLLLSALSGALFALAMPKPGLWIASWFCLVPLLVVMNQNIRISLLMGFICGVVYYGVILHWITLFGFFPWVLLVIKEAFFFCVFALIASRFITGKKGISGYIAIVSAWTALQWLRSLGSFGFTWGSFAHTQAPNTNFIQLASITGSWGLDFIVCLINVLIAVSVRYIICNRPLKLNAFKPLITAAIVTILTVICGRLLLTNSRVTNNVKNVTIIQANLPQDVVADEEYLRSSFSTFAKMTLKASVKKTDLIVWPETTLPVALEGSVWEALVAKMALYSNSGLLVGAYSSDRLDNSKLSNAAHYFLPNGIKGGVYKKVHLVPFGEYIPFKFMTNIAAKYGARENGIIPGKSHDLLDTNIGKLGVNICFESLFPQISRIESRNGAKSLCVVTNDAWFGRTQASEHHLMFSILRAVENRRPLIMASATGISAIIDPYGRVTAQQGIFKKTVVSGKITPVANMTLYTLYGDLLPYTCLIYVIVILIVDLKKGKANVYKD